MMELFNPCGTIGHSQSSAKDTINIHIVMYKNQYMSCKNFLFAVRRGTL